MKRQICLVAGLLVLGCSMVQAQDIKIKKGKVTMTEAQYNELMAKADALDNANRKIAELNARLAQPSPKTFLDSASYAIGRDLYGSWKQRGLVVDAKMAGQALLDDANGFSQLSDAQATQLLNRFQHEWERRQTAGIQDNIAAGEKYLAEISKNKSVYRTESGLHYRKLRDGNGKHPKATDVVQVHYTGTLIDGTKFDSSVDRGQPAEFPLNQVIPGWTEGLQLMDEGSKYILYLPYNLAYGRQGAGSIPGGATLVFEVELLKIIPR